MYGMIPSCRCSHFAIRNGQHILFGRNSDFLTCIEKLYMNCIYRLPAPSYSFIGNATAFIQMEDGVNEHGLAAGLTAVPCVTVKPGLNAGMILRLLLERCKNVSEAPEKIRSGPYLRTWETGAFTAAKETRRAGNLRKTEDFLFRHPVVKRTIRNSHYY